MLDPVNSPMNDSDSPRSGAAAAMIKKFPCVLCSKMVGMSLCSWRQLMCLHGSSPEMGSGIGKPPAIAIVPARQGGVWDVSAGAAVLG